MAITIYPFIIKTKDESENKQLMNHENIHLAQQKELFLIPFLIIFLFHSLYLLIRYWDITLAYKLNIFEREAFTNETNYEYLKTRKKFSWKNLKVSEEFKKQMLEIDIPISMRIPTTLFIFMLSLMSALIVYGFVK